MNIRSLTTRLILIVAVASLALSCASRRPAAAARARPPAVAASPTTRPILYHRTGGIAGTDDRLVVWPDGSVQVDGKLFAPAAGRVTGERHAKLAAMFQGWQGLKDEYLASDVADAYTITIHYGDKAVTASDIAPDLPQNFRDIFTELEAVAFEAGEGESGEAMKP